MKPRLFIGSSTEGLPVAHAAQQLLEQDAEVTVWDQGVFALSRYNLDSLLAHLDDADFGLFILSPDDLTTIRGEALRAARVNVVFELGLWIGRLGKERSFILLPAQADLRLPTDLSGIAVATYDVDRSDHNIAAAIASGCNRVRLALASSPIIDGQLRWQGPVPPGFVFLLNGGSGVGKTTVAWALARRLNIVSVFGTDLIREALRSEIDDTLFSKSTRWLEDENEFAAQCQRMSDAIVRIVNRVRTKRDPVIIEGINIICSQIFTKLPTDPYSKIMFINLYIQDEERHLARLRKRADTLHQPVELADEYVRRLGNIRRLDKFLKEDAQSLLSKRQNILSLDNSSSLSGTVFTIEQHFRQLRRQLADK
jgi:adenylate kinase family enzyme